MNVVYARLKPNGIVSTFLLALVLAFFRVSAWMFYRICKQLETAGELAALVTRGVSLEEPQCICFLGDQVTRFCSSTAFRPAAICGAASSTSCSDASPVWQSIFPV